MQKLKRLKICLNVWNKATFRDIFEAITATSAELLHIQNSVATHGDSSTLFDVEIECQIWLNRLLAQRQSHYLQKNRAHWLTDGDRNTKFFHTLHSLRKSSNFLNSMYIGDILSHDPVVIGGHVVDYYTELFSARTGGKSDFSALDGFMAPVVSEVHNLSLVKIPTTEEVKHVVFAMDGSSASSPDGFGGCFYHVCWDIIAVEVYAAVRFFFN
ncbi:hypothetical protein ACS0TY_035060 [Phlomoides rotata]